MELLEKLKSIQETITKAQKQMEKISKESRKELEDLVLTAVNSLSEDNPVQGVSWSQYTPYFMDGDPCIFGVNDLEFMIPFKEDEEMHESCEYDMYLCGQDVGLATSWTIRFPDQKKPKYLSEESWENRLLIDSPELNTLFETFNKLPRDFFLNAFGDHVRVSAMRGSTSLDVEHCDHD